MSAPTYGRRRSRLAAWSSCFTTLCGASNRVRVDDPRAMVKRATPQDLNGEGEEAKDEEMNGENISEMTDSVVVIHGSNDRVGSKGQGGGGRGVVGSLAAKDELERGMSLDYFSTQGTCEVVVPATPLPENVPVEITAVETSDRIPSSSAVGRQSSPSLAGTEASKEAPVSPSGTKKKKLPGQASIHKERMSEPRSVSVSSKKFTGVASTPGGAGALRKQTSGVPATPMRTQSRLGANKTGATPTRTQSRLSANKAAVVSGSSTYLKSPPDRKLSLDRLPSEARPSTISTNKAYKRQLSTSRITPAKPANSFRATSKLPSEKASRKMGTPLEKSSVRSKVLNRTASTDSTCVSMLHERSNSSLKANFPPKTYVSAKEAAPARSMSADSAGTSKNSAVALAKQPEAAVHRPSVIPEETLCSGSVLPTGLDMSPPPLLLLLALHPNTPMSAPDNSLNEEVNSSSQPLPPMPNSLRSPSETNVNVENLRDNAPSQPPPPLNDGEAIDRMSTARSEEQPGMHDGSSERAPLENEAAPSTAKKKKKKKKKKDSAEKRKKKRSDSHHPPNESPQPSRPESLMFVNLSTLDASLFKPPTSARVTDYLRRLREVSPYDLRLFPHPPSPPPKLHTSASSLPLEVTEADTEYGESDGELEYGTIDHDDCLDGDTRGDEFIEERADGDATAPKDLPTNQEMAA